MPTYCYHCTECDYLFESWQKMSDPVLVECPNCHKNSLEKQLTAPSFQLKGGGWYVTDFKGDSSKSSEQNTPPESKTT
jgi:putative FmdB family regulatory protein